MSMTQSWEGETLTTTWVADLKIKCMRLEKTFVLMVLAEDMIRVTQVQYQCQPFQGITEANWTPVPVPHFGRGLSYLVFCFQDPSTEAGAHRGLEIVFRSSRFGTMDRTKAVENIGQGEIGFELVVQYKGDLILQRKSLPVTSSRWDISPDYKGVEAIRFIPLRRLLTVELNLLLRSNFRLCAT